MIYQPSKVTKHAFIQGAIVNNLNNLIWHFDFQKQVNRHAYVGIPEPLYLIEIIRELIVDTDLGFARGDITRFENMISYLGNVTASAFEKGKQEAKNLWHSANSTQAEQYKNYKPLEYQPIAFSLAQEYVEGSEVSWFVEGFCRQWGNEWMQYILENEAK